MAEILIILWFSVVLCAISGFILGFLLGKTVTLKRLDAERCNAEEYLITLIDDQGDDTSN